MSTDITQQLKSEMSQVQVQLPPDLARQAYRRYRKRRLAGRAAVAGAAAVIMGAGTAVAAGATRSAPAIPQEQTTAYVVSHLSSALAATRTIAYTTTQFDAPGSTIIPRQLAWAYGNRLRFLDEAGNGAKLQDTGFSESRGTVTVVSVSYRSRTWYRVPSHLDGLPVTPDLCGPRHPLSGVARYGTAADLMSVIKSGLRCGALRVAGHQVLDGVDAIKLTVTFISGGPEIIWVNPSTYLPIQMVGHPEIYLAVAGTGINGKPVKLIRLSEVRTEFTWLPLTRASLAELTPPIPPGFRHVSG